MLFKLLPITLTIFSIITLVTEPPLLIGLLVMIMALMFTALSVFLLPSWMSMIIFLVYVGGLLVMFSYFLATQPNTKLIINKPFLILLFFMLYLLTLPWLLYPPLLPPKMSAPNLMLMLSSMNMFTISLMGSILLLTLIVVVFFMRVYIGPLRPHKAKKYHYN
uniref:NADH dehydrogenase subunit 6 n=1 Tax=Trypanobia cryptica TaxID=2814713 RepID=A0A0K0YD73_9ANNE|nr:NADH dehydrogenase subunit 6 [Trypanobia cryptica]